MNRSKWLQQMTGRIKKAVIRTAAVGLILTSVPAGVPAAQDYLQVTGRCDLVFPRDHGPHPGYRTEWWYYTGNLTGADQRRFGFQLTFFRRQLAPSGLRRQWPAPASPWRTDTIYLAHAAVTDVSGGRHYQAEKIARPVLSMAGAEKNGSRWTFHIDRWQAAMAADQHELEADTGAFSFQLSLSPTKPEVLHGDGGYSRKGHAPDRASCYYSYTRMLTRGTLTIEGEIHQVRGTAWMDHEFSTAALEPGITGWDWFSLQLSDQTEIMVFLLRQEDGELNPASSGTHVLPSGKTRHLAAGDFRFTPLEYWTSHHSGARYPVKWRISIPDLAYELEITANVIDQEMRTPQSTRISYWEGSIGVTGTKAERPVTGSGYIEMTGYARPLDTDL